MAVLRYTSNPLNLGSLNSSNILALRQKFIAGKLIEANAINLLIQLVNDAYNHYHSGYDLIYEAYGNTSGIGTTATTKNTGTAIAQGGSLSTLVASPLQEVNTDISKFPWS